MDHKRGRRWILADDAAKQFDMGSGTFRTSPLFSELRRFSVAGPRVWNTLPEEITTSQSLLTFRQQLKTWLFKKSYLDIII